MDDMKDRKQNGLNGDKQRGRDRCSSPGRRRRSRSPISCRSTERSAGYSSGASRRVFVPNFPSDKWTDLKGLLRDMVGNVTYCRLFENNNNKSRVGFVEFHDLASARKAIDILHRYEWNGRKLVVKGDSDCIRDRFGRIILPSNREREREKEIIVRTAMTLMSAPTVSLTTHMVLVHSFSNLLELRVRSVIVFLWQILTTKWTDISWKRYSKWPEK